MRIESIQFKNYKLLRDATLPLEPLTVIVGPNGSGKSSVLTALQQAAARDGTAIANARSAGVPWEEGVTAIRVRGTTRHEPGSLVWQVNRPPISGHGLVLVPEGEGETTELVQAVDSFKAFALSPDRMRQPVRLEPEVLLSSDGSTLSAALDQLRDRDPEAWRALHEELAVWLPEFDAVLFDTVAPGVRAVALRTKRGRHKIGLAELSTGTLLTLGLLTIVHGETAPKLLAVEEPEVGLHPRLLRDVYQALARVAYPSGDADRDARQVIITTHSPYFLDLFKDHPESVVIADRHEDDVTFSRLADHADVDDIVSAAPLGETWFSGVLGGVPVGPPLPTVYPAAAAA